MKGSYRNAGRWQKIWGWVWVSVWCALHYISPLYLASGFLVPALWGLSLGTIAWSSVVLLLTVYPHKPWKRARHIFRSWFELFELDYVTEADDIDPTKQYIACWSPHGVIPVAGYMGFTFFEVHLQQYFGSSAVANVLFWLPFIRQVLLWNSGISSDAQSLRHSLRSGRNVSIMPGGIAELFLSSREDEVLFIRQRLGIVKIAVTEGTPILPCYLFGNTQFFDQLATGKSLPARISRMLKMSFTLFYGRWYLPIPYPTKCAIVLGKPLPLPPGKTDADIKQYHELWMSEVQRIYHSYKHLANYPADKPLRLV